ncbi:MAG: sigma-70 family RNA polymerase sigma factor [Clostridiales bacterium]|jgi:RNA polymerase sporulation-specific sigma factor|nr:sigma-70 family RNA polymerase sigma factor [Clostridiales bacterium]
MSKIDQTTQLIREAKRGDREASERLVKENSGLIWSVARRFFGRGVEADDLYQLGCLGFLKAIEGYDESYGTRFSTYAVPKIGGEIRRFLRDDGSIKVSRSIKERANAIRHARERLNQQLGREPLLSELAEETGFTPEDIATAETATETPDSLQRENSEGGFTLESALGVDGMEDDVVESIALREAISMLSEKEQMLILLRFYRGMTQDKTAKVLGVSQVQVSRMEKKAIEFLRKAIA